MCRPSRHRQQNKIRVDISSLQVTVTVYSNSSPSQDSLLDAGFELTQKEQAAYIRKDMYSSRLRLEYIAVYGLLITYYICKLVNTFFTTLLR